MVVNLLSSVKRVQFNYSENNGKVIPGYLPNVGFLELWTLHLDLHLEVKPMLDMRSLKEVG